MNEYVKYTVTITLKSSIITPLQSDTIFGHVCWAIAFLKWDEDDKLKKFLSLYDEERNNPPLLISNGFPYGYVPKPVIRPPKQSDIDAVFDDTKRIENSFKIKTLKKANLLPKDLFDDLNKSSINTKDLLSTMKDKYNDIIKLHSMEQSIVLQHNKINRLTQKVEEGYLFSQEERFFSDNANKFEIYLKTNYFNIDELKRIFTYIAESGFGKDKSTGKGYFSFEISQGTNIVHSDNPNAFMTLSSYIPSAADPVNGYYNIMHKFGKLGRRHSEGFSEDNPFKVPLIMFSAGSTFFDKDFNENKVYGTLLSDVHKNKAIRHYAYAYPVGISIEAQDETI